MCWETVTALQPQLAAAVLCSLFVFSDFFLVALLRSKCSLLMEKTGECTNAHTYTHIYTYINNESPFYLNTLALDESFVLISLL